MSAVSEENHLDEWDAGLVSTLLTSSALFIIVVPLWLCCWRRTFPYIYFSRYLDQPLQKTVLKWILPTLLFRGQGLLKHSGMQGLLYLEWKELSLAFLVLNTCFGMFFIVPVYITQANPRLTFFQSTTASAIAAGSEELWTTFAYCIIIAVSFLFLLLVHNIRTIIVKHKHEKLGGSYLLVAQLKNFPSHVIDEEQMKICIEEITGVTVHNVSICWRSGSLMVNRKDLLKAGEKLRGYEAIYGDTGKRQKFRPSIHRKVPGLIIGNFKRKDGIDYYEKRVKKLREKVIKRRQKALAKKKHSGFGFVVFDSFADRELVVRDWSNLVKRFPNDELKPSEWHFSRAKPIEDLNWSNINSKTNHRTSIQLLGTLLIFILAMFWTIPITILTNVESLEQLPNVDGFVDYIFDLSPFFASLVENTLPALIQLLLFSFIAYICLLISKPEKHRYYSNLQASAMLKYWIFLFFNFYVFYLLVSSGLDLAQQLVDSGKNELRSAFEGLDWALYGSYYCNFLITLGIYDAVFTFLRLKKMFKMYFFRFVARYGTQEDKEYVFAPYKYKYYRIYAKEAVYFATILTFAPIVPAVSLCGLVAYSMGYLADKICIVSFCRYDPCLGRKMNLYFGAFINSSLVMTFLFWLFFFASKGAHDIIEVAFPSFVLLWICSVGILLGTAVLERFYEKVYSGDVIDLLQTEQSTRDIINTYSWEYVTDPDQDSFDPLLRYMLHSIV